MIRSTFDSKARRRGVHPVLTSEATNTSPFRPATGSGKMRVICYGPRFQSEHLVDSVAELDECLSLSGPKRTAPRRKDNAIRSETAEKVDAPSRLTDLPPQTDSTAQVVWINVDGVGDVKLLESLGKKFGLHPLALEDVVNVRQHAKLEVYGNDLYFVARMPNVGTGFSTEQVSLFLVDNVVITIQERPGDCLDPVRSRIAKSLGRIRQRGADYLAYAIIDAIIDGYFPVLVPYAEELDRASQNVASSKEQLPLRLHEIRADLLLIRKVLLQHRGALNTLMREAEELITEDTALYFRDCQDHINRLIESADTDRETCGELRELYFAMLGEKNNAVMKVLTIIATIFIPMSFVAGLYGMNFDSSVSSLNMPELRWAFGYPFALALMGGLAGGLVLYLYRKGWLS